MVIYRPHRGSLQESMSESVEFEDFEQMKQYIVDNDDELWGRTTLSVNDIVLDDNIVQDDRIGWKDVRHVCTKRYGRDDFIKKYGCPQCIGYCATEYKK